MTKRRLIPLIAGTVGVLLAGVVLIRAQQESDLRAPDTQKLILENMLVRVYDVHVPPGVAEPRHHHGRGLTIAMSDYDNETKSYPEGKINRGHNKFGEVRWGEPVTHEAKNIGTTEQHVVRVELK
jgi:hypothetical protein